MQTEKINYNYSTTLKTVNAKPRNAQTLFAISPYISITPISGQHVFLVNSQTQKTLVLQNTVLPIIESLTLFRYHDEHIKFTDKLMNLNGKHHEEIDNIYNQLSENGFLVTAEQLLQQIALTQPNHIETPPTIVIRTQSRVAILERFLQSAVLNEQLYNSRYSYIIIDDSEPHQFEANAANIAKINLNITHISCAEQLQIIEKFKTNITKNSNKNKESMTQAVDFLLGDNNHIASETCGRSWNLALLLTAGKPIVMLDDTCLLQAFSSPEEGVKTSQTSSKTTPTNFINFISLGKNIAKEVFFLNKEAEVSSQIAMLPIDIIASLAEKLGFALKQFNINEHSIHLASNLLIKQLDKNSTTILSSCGVVGEPGQSAINWLYTLSPDSSKRLIASDENTYLYNKKSRFALLNNTTSQINFAVASQISNTADIANITNSATVAIAVDNRTMLPATMPISLNENFGGESVIFQYLTNYLYQNRFTYDSNFSILHLGESDLIWDDKQLDIASNIELSTIILTLISADINDRNISASNISSKPAHKQLQHIATKLLNIASLNETEFGEYLYKIQQQNRANRLFLINKQLNNSVDAPQYYKTDLLRQIQANTQVKQDLELSAEHAKQYQQLLCDYANSLLVWNDLWEIAKQNPLI